MKPSAQYGAMFFLSVPSRLFLFFCSTSLCSTPADFVTACARQWRQARGQSDLHQAECSTDRHRQAQTGTDRHRQAQNRHRQTQTDTDRHRQAQTTVSMLGCQADVGSALLDLRRDLITHTQTYAHATSTWSKSMDHPDAGLQLNGEFVSQPTMPLLFRRG